MTTKEKLVLSALKLFNEKGFENTSTTSICKDAGFSSGALFVHFKTKNDLLDYIYTNTKKEYFNFVFNNVDNSLPVKQKIREIFKKSFEFYIVNNEAFVFLRSFSHSNHISRIAREEVDKEMGAFIKIYEDGKNEGIFDGKNSELVLIGIGGMFYSLIDFINKNGKDKIDECVDLLMKVILK